MAPFQFPSQTAFYKGKVRDVYTIQDRLLVMIVSDRISAFDVILPEPIPYKGQVLNQIAAYMLKATADICPNWLLETPAPHVSIGKKCVPFKIEMVVRGNLTGHAWRTYKSGKRSLCGVALPEGLKENDYFPTPIITPSTKASEGHDEDISKEDIIAKGLASAEDWAMLEKYTLALFERGKQIAAKRGLILVDTKYEFGKIGDTIYLMDEIHTPDSSRYFFADGFEDRQAKGEKQQQLSKEFVREWLIANNFMGKEGQTVPEMNPQWIDTISKRYIQLYEQVIGETFIPQAWTTEETKAAVEKSLEHLL
ncbi:phosphoribosylaminoimidazolesuccinocarboxamide synthase [Flavihumibacter cheonanensis]|uniref:phosphoribosylaminoimidazolesuccinocarboxamide synthase n=1 Tax=Flavihumibacter cheonanensis TaxID=1442385 RepID=UPI001EF97F89|nr:phosphoribosylaminoimidazolesuccinocarboxamide synthase [Flavihumibacter cheonanensis]MCG7751408.1 phosphoribosylaminoimidazolesuccinocarboxamide synthase [Flavihumibacter cheonanensis]